MTAAPDVKNEGEARLLRAAAALELADPRPTLRARLKQLRERDPETFRRALRHYEEQVVPGLGTDDALAVWIAYGSFLAELSTPGHVLAIAASGSARSWAPPLRPAELVLHVPVENGADVLIAVEPLSPSAAQAATIDLLVHGRLSL